MNRIGVCALFLRLPIAVTAVLTVIFFAESFNASAWSPWNYFWRRPEVWWSSSDFADGPAQGACGGIMPDYSRQTIREAASRWSWSRSMGPYFFFRENSSEPGSSVVVRCKNLGADLGHPEWYGVAEPYAYGDGEMWYTYVDFNNANWTWNNSGSCSWNGSSGSCDVLRAAVHEMGHAATAFHSDDANDVMSYSCCSRDLTYWGDALAAINGQGMGAGPNPDTESQRTPLRNWLDYSNGVWSAESYYQVATYPAAIDSGGRYFYIKGNPDQAYSYAYNKFYDLPTGTFGGITYQGIKVRSGMRLEWWQFNENINGANQYQMSVDLKLIDGAGNVSWARDSGLLDNYNTNMHPAARPAYINRWDYYVVGLNPIAGKRIIGIYAAFDNGSNGKTGWYRGVFENIAIRYP